MYNNTQIPNANCPHCKCILTVKTNRQQHSTGFGQQFAGCANFPQCGFTRPLTEDDRRAIEEKRAEFEKELQEQDW
jgi:ssDNA-binding Zn-finger/Zn-ribbon topoisomerase 1